MNDVKKLRAIAKDFRVLYVEDEESLRISVVTYLRKFFSKVVSAKDGLEGLDIYRKESFDIVITDIAMPHLNGVGMSRKIKQLNNNQELLVISAYKGAEYFSEFIKIGVSGYIIKPVDYLQMNDELYKIVDKLSRFRENELYHKHLNF